jgi:hypothetical protein
VYGIVVALVVIGVVLIGIGIWVFRQTRVDPELLAPLERMNDRSWSRRDPATQRRMLDEVRPDEAVPLHREPKEPEPDEEFDQAARPVESFDDLKEPESADASRAEDDVTSAIDDGDGDEEVLEPLDETSADDESAVGSRGDESGAGASDADGSGVDDASDADGSGVDDASDADRSSDPPTAEASAAAAGTADEWSPRRGEPRCR